MLFLKYNVDYGIFYVILYRYQHDVTTENFVTFINCSVCIFYKTFENLQAISLFKRMNILVFVYFDVYFLESFVE